MIDEATADLQRPRILLVDDHEQGRRSLCRLLETMGYEVTSVKDGVTALNSLKTGKAPDYVLTDLRLPDLDGLVVVEAAQRLDPRPKIALITGWDFDSHKSKELGIDWVFLKPLKIYEIVAKLREAYSPDRFLQDLVGNVEFPDLSSS